MKTTSTIGTIVLIFTMQTLTSCSAQNYRYTTNYDYDRQYTNYDLSEYLDLEAVASVFSFANDYQDFERRLNDAENNISNLDMNNDGYIDYLRVFKYTENGYHIIMIQAILGDNYYQDVATMIIDPNRSYRRAVQIIGEPSLYGANYIIEPEYRWEPPILRWMKYTRTYRYASPYYWNNYPRYYTYRSCIPMSHYFRHIRNNYYHHHRYYHPDRLRFSININLFDKYGRNDYWRDHRDRSFDYRYRDYDYRNRNDFDRNERSNKIQSEKNKGGSTGVINRSNNYSESERRETNAGGTINRNNESRETNTSGRGTINRTQTERDAVTPNSKPRVQPERPAPVVNPQRPGNSTEQTRPNTRTETVRPESRTEQVRPNTRTEQVKPESRTEQVRPNTRSEQPRTSTESSGRVRPSNPEPAKKATVEPKKETERSSGSSTSSDSRSKRTTERTSGSGSRR